MSRTTGLVTGAQLRQLYALCRSTKTELEEAAERFYGRKPGFLTIDQASSLITNLELLEDMETRNEHRNTGSNAVRNAAERI